MCWKEPKPEIECQRSTYTNRTTQCPQKQFCKHRMTILANWPDATENRVTPKKLTMQNLLRHNIMYGNSLKSIYMLLSKIT